jgi:hypothetical protein
MNNPTAKSLMVQPAAAFVAHSRTTRKTINQNKSSVRHHSHTSFFVPVVIPWPHTPRSSELTMQTQKRMQKNKSEPIYIYLTIAFHTKRKRFHFA